MSLAKLKLRDVMSASPFTVPGDETVGEARTLMKKRHIRHLVVTRGGDFVGVVSERDLRLAHGVGGDEAPLSKVMASEVYAVDADTPLAEVAFHMARSKISCTVALEGKRIAGIFTPVDALKVLGEILAGE